MSHCLYWACLALAGRQPRGVGVEVSSDSARLGPFQTFAAPSFDDKILEVVAVFGSMQMAVSRVIRLQHHRIAQVLARVPGELWRVRAWPEPLTLPDKCVPVHRAPQEDAPRTASPASLARARLTCLLDS